MEKISVFKLRIISYKNKPIILGYSVFGSHAPVPRYILFDGLLYLNYERNKAWKDGLNYTGG